MYVQTSKRLAYSHPEVTQVSFKTHLNFVPHHEGRGEEAVRELSREQEAFSEIYTYGRCALSYCTSLSLCHWSPTAINLIIYSKDVVCPLLETRVDFFVFLLFGPFWEMHKPLNWVARRSSPAAQTSVGASARPCCESTNAAWRAVRKCGLLPRCIAAAHERNRNSVVSLCMRTNQTNWSIERRPFPKRCRWTPPTYTIPTRPHTPTPPTRRYMASPSGVWHVVHGYFHDISWHPQSGET